MPNKLIQKYSYKLVSAEVRYNNSWNEYIVKFYSCGQYLLEYSTKSKEDALRLAHDKIVLLAHDNK